MGANTGRSMVARNRLGARAQWASCATMSYQGSVLSRAFMPMVAGALLAIPALGADPVIDGDPVVSVVMSEDANPTPFALALHAADPESDPITWSVSSNALNGTASVLGAGTNVTVSYLPTTNFFGADSFVVRASDSGALFDEVQVTVTVQSVNDAPRLQANVGLVTYEMTEVAITTNMLRAGDVDHGASELSFIEWSGQTNGATHEGTLRRNGQVVTNGGAFTMADVAAGLVTYSAPITPFNLAFDALVFRVRDAAGAYAADGSFSIFTFAIRIEDTNVPPQTVNGNTSAPLGGAVTGQFQAVDINLPANTLTFSIVSNGTHGVAVLTQPSSGLFTYTPTALVTGVDTILFQVNDGLASAATNGVMTISLVDAPPSANPGSITALRGEPTAGMLTGSDLLGQALTFQIASSPAKGTVTVEAATGAFVYEAAPGRFGADQFTFTAVDPLAQTSAPATVSVTITHRPTPGDLLFTLQIDQGTNPPLGAVAMMGTVAGDLLPLSMGGTLQDPRGIAYDPVRDAIYVAEGAGTPAIVEIDPDSGAQSVRSSGGLMAFPVGLTLGADRALYLANGAGANILRIDPASGTQSVFASGGFLQFPVGIEQGPDGNFLVTDIIDFGSPPGGLAIGVNAGSAVQTLVTSNQSLVLPIDACPVPGGAWAVIDIATGLTRVNPTNGSQSALTSFPGQAFGVTRSDDGGLYATCRLNNPQRGQIYRIDPTNGVATQLGGPAGTIMASPFGITHVPAVSPLALVADAPGAALRWSTVSGLVYRVSSTIALKPADWQPIGVVTGNGGTVRLPLSSGPAAEYFRFETDAK